MRTSRTYYEILGIPRGATLARIKRAYKQLVRKYHPDVASDKQTAHRLFIQITEAYQALSDPVRRRAYDATLDMEAPRTATTTTKPPPRAQPRQEVGISQHLKNAQWAFIQRRFQEATDHCKEALRADGRNARAYAILGDICRAQGKANSAVRYYGHALHYDPTDRATEKKLTDLVGKRLKRDRVRVQAVPSPARLALVNAVGWALAFFLIMLVGAYPGTPISWLAFYIPQISRWSWNLVGFMGAASFVVGALLSINGLVRHPDEELVFESGDSILAVIPTGIILLIGSGFFFIGAAAFYIVVGWIQGSLSRSVLTSFACVAAIVLLCAFLYGSDAVLQVILYGGNVAFLMSLFGWYLGSTLKPLSES